MNMIQRCKSLIRSKQRRAARIAALFFMSMLLASCGGGSGSADSLSALSNTPNATAAVGPAAIGTSTSADIIVVKMDKVSETRVTRTVFDYAFKATVLNSGVAQGGIVVTLKAVGSGATIVQGTLNVGKLESGASAIPNELIIIRQDRTVPFDPSALQFSVTTTGPVATTPTGTEKAEAVLLPEVLTLSPFDAGRITESTDTTVTFAGNIDFVPGSVFIAGDNAYKVVSEQKIAGTTVVTYAVPSIGEIFSRIEIVGSYNVTAEDEVARSTITSKNRLGPAPSAKVTAGGGGGEVPFKISNKIAAGPISLDVGLNGKLGLKVSYLYDKALGGLQNSKIEAVTAFDPSAEAAVLKGKFAGSKIELAEFKFPIILSLFDAVLSRIGFAPLEFKIPLTAKIDGESPFELSYKVTGHLSGTTTATFSKDNSSTITFDPTTSTDITTPFFKLDSKDFLTSKLSFYTEIEPQLAVFKKIAMVGLTIQSGPKLDIKAKLVPDNTPPYCANFETGYHAEVSAFVKTSVLKEDLKISTEVATKDVSFGKLPLIGSCLAATTTEITSVTGPGVPIIYGQLMTVKVLVKPELGKDIPGKVPTGTVKIASNDQTCDAIIDSKGIGTCMVKAGIAGIATGLEATYPGDDVYEKSSITGHVDIDKSPVAVSIAALPSTTVIGNAVRLTSTVGPSPDLRQKIPTGALIFVDGSGLTLCRASLDAAGTASCSTTPASVGTITVTAQYQGSTNYLTGKSSGATVTVTAPTSTTPTGAILHVDTIDTSFSGLPATISLSGLRKSTITNFEFTGNGSCGSERGTPFFSASVSSAADFYAAPVASGVPQQLGGPGVNRNNCSSFVAVQQVTSPTDPSVKKQRVWINGTGRGQSFGTAIQDWEYQVRFDSGDPFTGIGKRCDVGTVPNSNFYVVKFASACTFSLSF